MCNRESRFEQALSHQWFGNRFSETRALIAVSGGADSVALLRGLHALIADSSLLAVAHFNHGWRGVESDLDEQFVCNLCDDLNLPCHTAGAESVSADARSEAMARDQRYAFFQRVAYEIGARSIVTAHTANDRAETVLHNLFRGTGIAGMRSIEKTRPIGDELILVRPLIEMNRPEVEDYLRSIQQSFRQDSSNHDTSFKRNFLRHELMPCVEKNYGQTVMQNMLRFSEIAADIDDLLDSLALAYWEQVASLPLETRRRDNQIEFPLQRRLQVAAPVLQRAIAIRWNEAGWPLGKMARDHWQEILSAHKNSTTQESSEHLANLPGNVVLHRRKDWLILQRLENT